MNIERLRRNTAAAVLVTAASLAAMAPTMTMAAAVSVDAITTPGSGTLTKCRSWIVYRSCATYHRIALPAQIAVGDEISLTYGSNRKNYVFRVVRIRREGDSCTIWSDGSGPKGEGETLEIAPCPPARNPASEKR